MAEVCPPIKSEQWQEFVNKVGKDNAYKMWIENGSNDNAVDEMARILDPERYTISEKINKLKSAANKILAIRDVDPKTGDRKHEYKDTATGKELISVSRVLDENDDTKYKGSDVGRIYAEKGTSVHSVFEKVIDGESDTNIRKLINDEGLPDSLLGDVKNIVDRLKQKGTLVAESIVGDVDNGIAGATDITRFNFDGTVDIIDIKTAHRTPNMRSGDKTWDPIHHFGGYKSRRYPTQTEFYSRLVERSIDQPVSKKYILPLEIRYKDNNPAKGYDSVTPLELEDTEQYGYFRRSKEIVDEYFGEAPVVDRVSLTNIDDSTEMIEHITGAPEGRTVDFDKQATLILNRRGSTRRRRGRLEYSAGNEWKVLRSNDPVEQKQQIIDEYLKQIDNAQRNVVESIINYVKTGEDAFLDDPGQYANTIAKNLKDWTKLYSEKTEIYELNKIKGFENKQGWIVFQEGNVFDLLYVGSDLLDQKINTINSGTLFGNYMTNGQATHFLGSKLKNTRKDAKILEGALIMMTMKEAMREATFERAFVYSAYDNRAKAPAEIKLKELLPVIEKIKQRPEFQDILPTNMKNIMANEEFFKVDNYRQNYIKAYQDYVFVNKLAKDRKILSSIEDYVRDKDNSKELELEILKTINQLSYQDDPKFARELYLLSQMYYELRGVNTMTNPIDIGRKILNMPNSIKNAVMADLISQTTNSLNRFKRNYWEGYKDPSTKYFRTLFNKSGAGSIVSNYLLADTTKMYNSLFEKKTFTKAGTDETVELSTFNMIREGSSEFESLRKDQQEFITMFNDYVQEGAKKAGLIDLQTGEVQWVRGRIPLVRKSALRQLGKAVKTFDRDKFREIIGNSFNENFIFTGDNLQAEQKNIINLYSNQQNNNMSDPRLDMLGIDQNDTVDISLYDQFETNMEIVLDMFMINANKNAELKRAGWVFSAAKALMDYQKSSFFNESLGANIDWVEVWRNAMLNNRDKVDSNVSRGAMNIVKPTNYLASLAIIGFKPTTAIVATLGQQFTLISKSIANSYTGSGLFTAKSLAKAGTVLLNPRNYKKIDLIMNQYNLFDMDVNALASSQRRNTDRFLGNTKYAYQFLRWGDWATRAQAIVAQMIHDGNWNAHTVVDGKLIYDESLDKRFNGEGRFNLEEGRALKSVLTTQLEQEGYMTEGRMQRAYDDLLANKHKDIADSTFGGMDKETRSFYNYTWFGKLLGLFRSWLPARIDIATQKPGERLAAGDYKFTRDQNGEMYAEWQGEMVEGFFYTLKLFGFNLRQYMKGLETQPMTDQQKGNMVRMSADLVLMGAMALVASLGVDDEDDTKLDSELADLLQKSMQDVMVTYTLHQELARLFAPVPALSYAIRLQETLMHVLTGIPDGDIQVEKLLRVTPFSREYRIMSEIMT